MAVQDAISTLTDSGTLENIAYLAGGYVASEQVTRRLVNSFDMGVNLPDETYGVVTALALYGYGDRVVSGSTADKMGHGALLHSVDEFSNRPQIRNILGGNFGGNN